MIALAAVACAAAVQAASFTWASGTKSYFTDDTGAKITDAATYSSYLQGGSIVLVLLSDGTYDGAKTVLTGNSGDTAALVTSGTASAKGRLSTTFGFTYDDTPGAANILENGDVLGVMFRDSSGNLSQLVYSDDSKVNATYTVSGLSDNTWAGSAFSFTAANTTFTASVPEPTSGLLLLLGMAGLALKRKRA